jgi:4-amino-4-deoxy-L-arabinose transferase-like glycosyltransferase
VTAATAAAATPRTAAALAATALFICSLTILRLGVLFVSPLELYPDEAQYWAWSRELAFGYFSKPPLIAWLIHLTTAVGGDDEPWVRLAAPLLHAGAALALYRVGARLYGAWSGLMAAVVYSLMPGVQLSSGVIATDAPLLFFLSLALLAYVGLTQAEGRRAAWAAGLGAALGLALLSKYAAVYFVLGLALHAALDRRARAAWGWREVAAAAVACLVFLGPNLAWNAGHGFATLGHLLANTDWLPDPDEAVHGAEPLLSLDLRQTPGFLVSQLGVFGPVPFLVLVGGAAVLARRGRLEGADRLLLAFVLPPLLVVVAQAVAARANANWAGAAYAPGAVLVGAWLVRWRARVLVALTVAVQGALAALLLVVAARPDVADRMGLANSLKRVRGWDAATRAVLARAGAEPGLTAIAVDDRFLFNAMTYYGRDRLAAPGAPPLTMWMRRPTANTQAEVEAPLTPARGGRVLAASLDDVYLDEMRGDFRAASPPTPVEIRLDAERSRRVTLFVGEGLAPAPRDPRTGLPVRPAAP